MEKIKQAIQKAKSQQLHENAGKPEGNGKLSRVVAKSMRDDDDLASIKYDTTQVHTCDYAHLENNRVVAIDKNNPASWIYDSLRTQVLQTMEENNWRTIAVISPTPESGKSLTSINLAISISQQPQKTALLVDFDLRKPRVANYLGLKTEKSINDYLVGQASVEEIMVNPGIPHLTVLPTNRPVSNSSEALSTKAVERLVTELRERYDSRIIIFDLPPMLSSDDAMVLLPLVDCALLIIADGMSTEDEINETMRLLSKTNIVGVVVNKADIEPRAYYY